MSIWNSACADGIEAKAISTAYRQFTTAKALTMVCELSENKIYNLCMSLVLGTVMYPW